MTSTATLPDIKEAFTLEAYGLEIRLWKGTGNTEWGGMLRAGADIIFADFEADNLASAQRYLAAESRSLASYRWEGNATEMYDAPLADEWRSWSF